MGKAKFRAKNKAPLSVSSVLERTLGAYRLDKKLEQYAAFPAWPEIVGEEIAAIALPEKIVRGNTLVVRVEDAVWAQELSMIKKDILQRIFEHGSGALIEDIRFATGNPKTFGK